MIGSLRIRVPTNMPVDSTDAEKREAAFRVGSRIASPPVLTPFPRSVLRSSSMGPLMPVIAGMNFVRRAFSTGARLGPTSGTVRQMHCHSALRQETSPA